MTRNRWRSAAVIGLIAAATSQPLSSAIAQPLEKPPVNAPRSEPAPIAAQAAPMTTPAVTAPQAAQEQPIDLSEPNPLAPFRTGPIEMKAMPVLVSKQSNQDCYNAVFRITVRNASAADLKLGLLTPLTEAADNLGVNLMKHTPDYETGEIKGGGIALIRGHARELDKTIDQAKYSLVTISPRQIFTFQMGNANCYNASERTYRPQSATLSGSLVVIDLQGTAERRAFSFADLPVQLGGR
jgi:hypothetical protein